MHPSQSKFCIAICIPQAGEQAASSIIFGFKDSASFERTKLSFEIGLNRCARGSCGSGRSADQTLIWDHLVSYDDLFKSTFSDTGQMICMRFGCLCSMESRRFASQPHVDSYLLCNCVKVDLEQIFKEKGVKLARDIEITKSSSSMITICGPHIHWQLDRLWYEKRCVGAAVIQRFFREQQLIKKLRSLKDDLMQVKPRRVSSYLKPFCGTHVDDSVAAQIQSLLNLHADWPGFGEARKSLKVLFAAPLEGVVVPRSGNPPFEWLSEQYLVIVPEFVLIFGRNMTGTDTNALKFSLQHDIPEMFVQQCIPISQICEVLLSTFADNAMVRCSVDIHAFAVCS
jgi:hypothetical protein